MRLYRLLLFAFPADVRREFGDDMAEMFARQIEETRRLHRSVVFLWIRSVVDAIAHGFGQRITPVRPAGEKPPRFRGRSSCGRSCRT